MPEITVSLVQEAIAGNRQAFRELVNALTPVIQARVGRVLLRHRGDSGWDPRQEVQDFVQQIFVVLFEDDARALRQWDPARGRSLTSFVSLIAEREVFSILRSRVQNPWTEEPIEPADDAGSEDGGPESVMVSREAIAAIFAAVKARLGERGLELFRMVVVEERPIEEITAITGMTRDAVYAWHTRCRRLLREVAAELASDPAEAARKAGGRMP